MISLHKSYDTAHDIIHHIIYDHDFLCCYFFNYPDLSDSLREIWNNLPDYSDHSVMHGTIFLKFSDYPNCSVTHGAISLIIRIAS